MVSTRSLNYYGRAYVWAVVGLGVLVVGNSLHELYDHPPSGYQWFLLAALTLLSGSATVKLPGIYASITISETFVFTAVLLYGPSAGTLIVALDGLIISFWIAKRHREVHRALFNMSAPAVALWCSAQLFFYIANVKPLSEEAVSLDRILGPLVVFSLVYFGLS